MEKDNYKILVLFVEPMRYGLDRIKEVYERSPYTFKYVYCEQRVTGKEDLNLPADSIVCTGANFDKKKQFISVIEDFKPDFCIINGYVGTVQTVAIKYCQKHGIRYAIESDTPLNIPRNRIKRLLKKIYLKRILSNYYCYGFPGGSLQKENFIFYGIPEEKNYIMPMSVSLDRLNKEEIKLPSTEKLKQELGILNKITFLFVGRLEHVKNVSLLLKAFSMLKKNNDNVALIIVGDGTLKTELEEQVRDSEVQDVYFKGYVAFPEIVRYYKASDVFVLPSVFEPWGLVVNEAMTLGLPAVVSSDVGCRKDLIETGNNGYIFESDNVYDLLEKLESIIKLDIASASRFAVNKISQWNYNYYLKVFLGAIEDVKQS